MNSPPYHYFRHHQKQFPLPTEHSYPDLTHTHTLQQQNYVSASPFYHQQPTLHHSIHKPFTQPPPNYSSNIYQQPNTYQEPLNIITASSPPPICNPNFYQDPSFKYHQSVISSNPYTPYATVSHPYNYGYSTYHNNYPNQSHNPYSQSIGASQHTEVTQNSVNEFFQSSKDSVNEVRELNQASHQSLQNSVHEISELLNKLKELLIEESVEKNKQSSEKSTEVIETVVVQAPPDLTIASSPDLSSASSQPLPPWKPPVLKSHPYSIVPSSSTQSLLSTPPSISSSLRPPTKPPDVQSQLSGFLFLREIFVNLFHDPVFWSKGIQINELIFASNMGIEIPLFSMILCPLQFQHASCFTNMVMYELHFCPLVCFNGYQGTINLVNVLLCGISTPIDYPTHLFKEFRLATWYIAICLTYAIYFANVFQSNSRAMSVHICDSLLRVQDSTYLLHETPNNKGVNVVESLNIKACQFISYGRSGNSIFSVLRYKYHQELFMVVHYYKYYFDENNHLLWYHLVQLLHFEYVRLITLANQCICVLVFDAIDKPLDIDESITNTSYWVTCNIACIKCGSNSCNVSSLSLKPSMNCSVILISLTVGDFFKHGSSNWVLCLVNCVSSLFCLEAKPPDWKLWCGNLVLIFYEKFVNLGPWFDLMAVMSRNATVEYMLTYILLHFDLEDKITFRGVGNDMVSVCNTFLSKAYSRQHGRSCVLVLLEIINDLWQNENGSLSPAYQIAVIKEILGIGTTSHVLMELFKVNTLNFHSSFTHYSNNSTSVEIVQWYQDALWKTKARIDCVQVLLCMLQFPEILVFGVMRLAQVAHWFSVYLGFTHMDGDNKDSELDDIYTKSIMLNEMRQETINEFLIHCVYFKQQDPGQHLCMSSTERSSKSKQWDPGKLIQSTNFYNLEDKVDLEGVDIDRIIKIMSTNLVTHLVLEAKMTHLDLEGSNIGSNIEYVRVHLSYCGCVFTYLSIV